VKASFTRDNVGLLEITPTTNIGSRFAPQLSSATSVAAPVVILKTWIATTSPMTVLVLSF
jgi:hypothetical protein